MKKKTVDIVIPKSILDKLDELREDGDSRAKIIVDILVKHFEESE